MSPMLALAGGGGEGAACWHPATKRTARKVADKINLPVKSLSITLYFPLVLPLSVKVYLAIALGQARQTFVVAGYAGYSFLLKHPRSLPRQILAWLSRRPPFDFNLSFV